MARLSLLAYVLPHNVLARLATYVLYLYIVGCKEMSTKPKKSKSGWGEGFVHMTYMIKYWLFLNDIIFCLVSSIYHQLTAQVQILSHLSDHFSLH